MRSTSATTGSRSALLFDPINSLRAVTYDDAFSELTLECQKFAEHVGRLVRVIFQHSLKHDLFAVMVTSPPRPGHHGTDYVFHSVGNTFEQALDKVVRRMQRVRYEVEKRASDWKTLSKKKSASGAKGSRRRRGPSPTGKRRTLVLQERR